MLVLRCSRGRCCRFRTRCVPLWALEMESKGKCGWRVQDDMCSGSWAWPAGRKRWVGHAECGVGREAESVGGVRLEGLGRHVLGQLGVAYGEGGGPC